jgi:hypothetical protein
MGQAGPVGYHATVKQGRKSSALAANGGAAIAGFATGTAFHFYPVNAVAALAVCAAVAYLVWRWKG